MTGKNLPRDIRTSIDAVLRKRIVHQTYFQPDRYTALLDEITAEVMTVIWTAD